MEHSRMAIEACSKEFSTLLDNDQPVPFLSDNIATLIIEKLKEENYDFIVEFGAGSSTRYFLAKLIEFGKNCTLISVEYNYKWFKGLVKLIQADLESISTSHEKLILKPWSYEKCERYLRGKNATLLNVPEDLKRLPKAREAFGGPFGLKMLPRRLVKASRPIDGHYAITIDNSINLRLILRSELMKDQYGESPVKQEYIGAALEPIKRELSSAGTIKAAFLIDGGPRGDIVHSILDLEEISSDFCPTVVLWDAYRFFYGEAIRRRPSGAFIRGSNRTLKGEPVYETCDLGKKAHFWSDNARVSPDEWAKREVWFYQSSQGHEH
jgi:hypothetical protein